MSSRILIAIKKPIQQGGRLACRTGLMCSRVQPTIENYPTDAKLLSCRDNIFVERQTRIDQTPQGAKPGFLPSIASFKVSSLRDDGHLFDIVFYKYSVPNGTGLMSSRILLPIKNPIRQGGRLACRTGLMCSRVLPTMENNPIAAKLLSCKDNIFVER